MQWLKILGAKINYFLSTKRTAACDVQVEVIKKAPLS